MKKYLSLVKFSHTIFALPFALTGFFFALSERGSEVSWRLLGLVLLCMVFARSAAMAFNRWLDREIDASNPRTAIREIPSGQISASAALVFVVVNALLFMLSAFWINLLCFYLSPVALLVILGYSYTKRFTWFCHFVLGLGLSLAPVGAYLAVTASFSWAPVILGLAVLTWVAGFDIIYALQDEQFDRSKELYSVPVWLGGNKALTLSSSVHILSAILLIFSVVLMESSLGRTTLGLIWIGTVLFLGLLYYQHRLVKPEDLSKVNLAFFTTNGVASLLFGFFAILDFLIR
jgi:4-hydroxybenzoate polyprenyltransferase